MIAEWVIWLIFLLPLASFAIISLVIRPFLDRFSLLSGLLLSASLLVSFLISVWLLRQSAHGMHLEYEPHLWLDLGNSSISFGLLLDPVTTVMLVVVTGISLLVQVYSLGYMKGDPGFSRYFAYMALFTASMLGLTLASNIVQLYFFWELVGISSYLLIGFWHHRPAAAAAAKKAFIITRIGDVGFLIAIIYLFVQGDEFAAAGMNSLHIPHILEAAAVSGIGFGVYSLPLVAMGIFAGAAGKSGQFPFHTWLPDAMEGPTPVSALIHAATMVAAGVFLVARFYPLFEASREVMTIVALVGAFTAFMAATMGLVMNDIKRVMAYSTVSQLGYMMAALGVGAFPAALFHLFTHAFFKALLFLGAGSVNHAAGTFNMRYMGGLARQMPWTYATTLVGGLSLVGVVPFAGFWSKDEIIAGASLAGNVIDPGLGMVVYVLLLAGVFLTGLYTFRMIYLTFHGRFRGGGVQELLDARQSGQPPSSGVSEHVHLAESPAVMVVPLVILGFAAVVVGYLVNPQWIESFLLIPKHWITEYVAGALVFGHPELHDFDIRTAAVSTAVALAGIAVASVLYLRVTRSIEGDLREPMERGGFLHTLVAQKYYMDALYEALLVRRVFYGWFVEAADWIDRNIVDGLVDLAGNATRSVGRVTAQFQTGQVQFYGAFLLMGVIVIVVGYFIFGRPGPGSP